MKMKKRDNEYSKNRIKDTIYALQVYVEYCEKFQELCQDYNIGVLGESVFEAIYKYVKERQRKIG
jgi:hypothetical protein